MSSPPLWRKFIFMSTLRFCSVFYPNKLYIETAFSDRSLYRLGKGTNIFSHVRKESFFSVLSYFYFFELCRQRHADNIFILKKMSLCQRFSLWYVQSCKNFTQIVVKICGPMNFMTKLTGSTVVYSIPT